MNAVAYVMLGITGVLALLGLAVAWSSHKAHQRKFRSRSDLRAEVPPMEGNAGEQIRSSRDNERF
jgi:hypothetical protein